MTRHTLRTMLTRKSRGLRRSQTCLGALFIIVAVLSIAAPALKGHANAIVTTDQSDYQAGTIVTIFGESFNPTSIVTVSVTDPSNAVQSWQVSTDAYGSFVTT